MSTVRQQIVLLLLERSMSAREISQAIGIREKEVYEHLPHIARTLVSEGKKLVELPVRCLACGYVFRERKRFGRRSRCPLCKNSHIEEPRYQIV